jgi:hypothetical protein
MTDSAKKFDPARAAEYAQQSRIALAGYEACHELTARLLAPRLEVAVTRGCWWWVRAELPRSLSPQESWSPPGISRRLTRRSRCSTLPSPSYMNTGLPIVRTSISATSTICLRMISSMRRP